MQQKKKAALNCGAIAQAQPARPDGDLAACQRTRADRAHPAAVLAAWAHSSIRASNTIAIIGGSVETIKKAKKQIEAEVGPIDIEKAKAHPRENKKSHLF